MAGIVRFEGDPPFDLGTAQRASARSVNGGVEIALFLVLPDHGPLPQQIPVRMSAKVARSLATELAHAAVEAEIK